MIFVSTGGVKDKSAVETAAMYLENSIYAVELSGGCYAPNQLLQLKKLANELTFQVHNYFPPPHESFVLNLASLNKVIEERSFEHIKTAIQWSVDLGRPVYSFHAGFLIDPQVSELGKPIKKRALNNRHDALTKFGERILSLAEIARQQGVTLLIENNVISAANMDIFKEDPMLFSRPEEIVNFMEEMPSNVGLLLDVAHLKVSAKTLGFDMVDAHHQVSQFIKGYHLSDNDGLSDSNQIVTNDSWFWNVIQNGLDYYSIEVYGVSPVELFNQHKLVKTKLSLK